MPAIGLAGGYGTIAATLREIIKTFRKSAEIGRLFAGRLTAAEEIGRTAMFGYILSACLVKVKPAMYCGLAHGCVHT